MFLNMSECRKIKKSGKTAACSEDEIAVGCQGTGVRGCEVSQAYGGQGCAVNKDSCGYDFVMKNAPVITAVCCKRNAVRIQN
jgi:hypothetical protein